MSDADELERLETQERAVSARRRRLHDRVDFARQSAAAGAPSVDLDALLAEERAVSEERRALHVTIDELRVKLGKEPGPPPRKRLRD